MSFVAQNSNNLPVVITETVLQLTRPLMVLQGSGIPITSIARLQILLEASLIAHCKPTWNESNPALGSGRRALSLSPRCSPPRLIHNVCVGAGIRWADWIAALGNREMDLFIDPGKISVRFSGAGNALVTLWSPREEEERQRVQNRAQARAALLSHKTFAQRLKLDIANDETELFEMIADEVAAATFKTPTIITEFSKMNGALQTQNMRSISPISSGSSSSASDSDYQESIWSLDDAASSVNTSAACSPVITSNGLLPERRERVRPVRIHIDKVTKGPAEFDGGKTTVLSGGIMLGVAPPSPKKAKYVAPIGRPAPKRNTVRFA